jgi:hypothetical protein
MDPEQHPFTRYLLKHGYYPRARIALDKHTLLDVYVAPGYLMIRTSSSGRSPYTQEIYIPRSKLLKLLKWVVPLARQMTQEVYPPATAADYYEADRQLEDSLRRAKRERDASYATPRASRKRRKP